MKDTKEKLLALVGETIQFTSNIEKTELDFDEGMKAVIIDLDFKDEQYDMVSIKVDFSKFEDYNIPRMKANYFDDKRNAKLKWKDMKFYPADKISDDYYALNGHDNWETMFTVVE